MRRKPVAGGLRAAYGSCLGMLRRVLTKTEGVAVGILEEGKPNAVSHIIYFTDLHALLLQSVTCLLDVIDDKRCHGTACSDSGRVHIQSDGNTWKHTELPPCRRVVLFVWN